MRKMRWFKLFIIFGLFGTLGEIVIGTITSFFYNPYFYIYYNGFHTSIESFFWFGLFGCIGFKIFLRKYGNQLFNN